MEIRVSNDWRCAAALQIDAAAGARTSLICARGPAARSRFHNAPTVPTRVRPRAIDRGADYVVCAQRKVQLMASAKGSVPAANKSAIPRMGGPHTSADRPVVAASDTAHPARAAGAQRRRQKQVTTASKLNSEQAS